MMQNQKAQFVDMPRAGDSLQVAVEERRGEPGVWTVEAIDINGDGDIYQALFYGPDAKKRAYEYAHFKYSFAC